MSMKLAILGLLLERDMHPYEMMLVMRDRAMDRITKLQMGSLYYAVDQLAKSGQIEQVEIIRSIDRPDKTIYRITDSGKSLFEQLLLQQFRKNDAIFHPMYIALAFSRHVDPDKIAKLLEERIREAEHQVNLAYQVYEEHIPSVSRAALHLMYGKYEHSMTELKWLKRLYSDVRAQRLGDVGEPLDLNVQ
ncbi:PadR family transcriptional regulator [Paenibacillus sabinae]|uniref:PadR-like family transcriptional regulator n=1 Tax=Paenibacillus sabinae T27 TaxID=1268072 RepID=X4ZCK4_9BACL|nr:PadR family transcriptional regulator [Paenibacillus sabinae]AHV95242.1 PadR-like family transcriptional regulator [Paenibacillus sabinae T27]